MIEFLARAAEIDDAALIAADAREADRQEWASAAGKDDFRLLLRNQIWASQLATGAFSRTLLQHGVGRPLVIWGLFAIQPEIAGPIIGEAWMVASNRAAAMAWELHSVLRTELALLDAAFPRSDCWADDRNTVHHRWIGVLGFTLIETIPYGAEKRPFRHYTRSRR